MKAILISILISTLGYTTSFAQSEANRAVAVKGAVNFRDVGGYETKQGTHVKWGKVYRSAEISKLTDSDLLVLNAKHIDHIVDFRGDDEVSKAKDRLPAGAKYIQLAAGSEALGSFMAQLPALQSGDSLMISFYSKTSHLKAKYKPFFEDLLTLPDSSALLFHCTAGKDRTGIGAALLLHALGVSDDDIMNDYLLTNEYRKTENEKMVAMMTKMGIKEQVAKDLSGVKSQYLAAAYNAITDKYGSVDLFLSKEIGLSSNDMALLRKKYTN